MNGEYSDGGDWGPMDIETAVRSAARQLALDDAIEGQRVRLNRGVPFETMRLDLSVATPQPYSGQGYGLVYRREGSAPGGRIDVFLNGKFEALYPGSRIFGSFDGFIVARNARSAVKGLGYLVVLKRPDANFIEPDTSPAQRLEPVDLLGDSRAGTFVTVARETQPSGANPTGSFDSTGWSRIRIFVELASLASFQVTPWVREPNSAKWFPQPTQNVTMVDTGGASGGTAYDRRVFVLELDATGLTFLEFRDMSPDADPTVIVQGIA